MDKASISSNYMEGMKALHAGKPFRQMRRVAITGIGRPGSIAQAIMNAVNNDPKALAVPLFGNVLLTELVPSEETDTLILCHGKCHLDWLEKVPEETVEDLIEINLTSHIKIISRFVQMTIDKPYRKQIIMIGSMAHKAVLNGSSAYCAAKAGLNHYARCAAWELAPKGFDVFCINPSNTKGTAMTEDTIKGLMEYRGISREEAEGYWGACLPRAEWLTTENIADLVTFLMSGKGSYLAGTPLDLPGGQR